ncbi:phage distal tail protein [Streptomyces orinoci]|uniref:Phage tail domain-containing protein n=1 Tax=Streptomyces orinoci TaxID=67339 RepID=A0ABV3K1N5_STRON|nr:phage tail domain-containing protein [Streptomyces orinoci]
MAAGDIVTAPGHIQFGDVLLGPGTPYRWQSLTGWEDSPGLDSGTVNRADAHGAWPGRLLAQPRTITVDGLVVRAEPGAVGAVVRHLAAATALRDGELPLVVRLDDSPPLLSWARCIRRSVPVTRGYAAGVATGGALQFEATDPRRYALDEQLVTARLPTAEPGLDWHLDPGPEGLSWPLDFGPPGATGALVAVNDGDAPVHPVISFRGPLTLPSLTNVATAERIEYDITLAPDDELLVDTAAGTVTLNHSASRLYTVTPQSVPEATFVLAPGTNNFAFRAAPGSSDPRAACSMRWRSAYW